MRRAGTILLTLSLAVAAVTGCGGDDDDSSAQPASTTPAPAPTTQTPAATQTTPAPGARTGFVNVASLLGKPLPKEPGCRFSKNFVPEKPSPAAYDGALVLTLTCARADGYTPVGQVVNRRGNKRTEISCRDGQPGQFFCIYVPSTSVGLAFTGTDKAVVRRRLEHLIEVVAPLPTGITPLSGAGTP